MKSYLFLLFTVLHNGFYAQYIHFKDKSTSKGNGLGLNLADDQVEKWYRDYIQANSSDGNGPAFIIE